MKVANTITLILCILVFYFTMIRPLIKERNKYLARHKKGALYGR